MKAGYVNFRPCYSCSNAKVVGDIEVCNSCQHTRLAEFWVLQPVQVLRRRHDD